MRMIAQEDENDNNAEVTWEDQQRINAFSKLNTRVKGIEEKMEALKQEKEALDDLGMELELADEDQPVLYRVGEAFVHLRHAQALRRLEKDQGAIAAELEGLAAQTEGCEKEMKALKVVLYAKFGRAINLDE
ncbi:prefoldin subunit [Phanerochaete sordida]|uniref:Prefoldin subunit 4 n=1 Tax=Phanerochaete sordida TaxID=48140 RepID=A0A9P3GFB7_9APHY|nr:prefoldin subunit [Phanerochaete sordida]